VQRGECLAQEECAAQQLQPRPVLHMRSISCGLSLHAILAYSWSSNRLLLVYQPACLLVVALQVIDASGGVSWEDIAGLETAKHLIKEIVVWPMLNPHLFTVRGHAQQQQQRQCGCCRLCPAVLQGSQSHSHDAQCSHLHLFTSVCLCVCGACRARVLPPRASCCLGPLALARHSSARQWRQTSGVCGLCGLFGGARTASSARAAVENLKPVNILSVYTPLPAMLLPCSSEHASCPGQPKPLPSCSHASAVQTQDRCCCSPPAGRPSSASVPAASPANGSGRERRWWVLGCRACGDSSMGSSQLPSIRDLQQAVDSICTAHQAL
jgi:hypothetical protein